MATNESKLNETLTKVFEYIDWFREYDRAPTDTDKKHLVMRYPNEISSLLLSTKIKVEKYFDEIVDQPIYLTDDYLRLRKFLIHWYAAYNTITREELQLSDINFIDRSLLLQSLGYTLYGEHSNQHQKTLCTQLSDMYAQKGTPLCMAKVLSLLDISNFTIFEYWLERDPSDNLLMFNPKPIDDMSYNTGFQLEGRPAKPFDSVINEDPHWYITESEIEVAEADGQLGLPSMTPYIGLISANDWVRNSKLVMAYVNRLSVDQYDKFLNLPGYTLDEDRKYYFYQIAGNISILELYLSIGYTYNELYGRTNIAARNNIDERVPHWNGDENVLLSEIQFITEFNQVYKRTYDRDERETLLQKAQDDWQTLNPIVTWTHAECATALDNVNHELKALCDNMLSGGTQSGFDFLKELLLVLDYYVKHDLGLTSYTSLFMLYDPLQENRDSLDKVLNFFKPYPTRLIEALSYLIINDVPGDCMATKEIFDMIIYHRIYEMYNEWHDLLRQRIFDRYYDIAGRDTCPTMFCDLLNQIIIDRHFEMDLDFDDKIFKIKISEAFVELYTLYNDMLKFKTKDKIGFDRYGFNELPESGTWPWPVAVVHIVNMAKVFNKVKSEYPEYRAHKIINHLQQLFGDWYTVIFDKPNMVIKPSPFKEEILPLIMKDVNIYDVFEKILDTNLIEEDMQEHYKEVLAEWCVIFNDTFNMSITPTTIKEDILPLIMKVIDMLRIIERIKDIVMNRDDFNTKKEVLNVDNSVIYKDDITIIQNDR